MQRYFCNNYHDGLFTLSIEDSYHITKVMRYSLDTNIEIVYDNKLFIANIVNLSPSVTAKIVKEEKVEVNNTYITIAQGLVKEQKMDYILQKGTELGMYEFIPVSLERSIVKFDSKENKKIERWKTIVKEASEQSKRLDIPIVNKIMSIKELAKLDYDYKLICSVNETSKNIKTVLSKIKESDRILFVIGPEGGFDPKEENLLLEHGFISVSLGNRVLRTETASMFVLSVINYIFMR